MCESQLLFAQLKRLNHLISVPTSLKIGLYDKIKLCRDYTKFHLCFEDLYYPSHCPSSACKAKQSFSMLRRLKTQLCSTQTLRRLNDLAILNTHRDDINTLDLNVVVNESVCKTRLTATCLE